MMYAKKKLKAKPCSKYAYVEMDRCKYMRNQHTVPRVIIVVVRALVRAQIPQLDGLVLGRRRDHEAVRREDGGAHPVDVAAERAAEAAAASRNDWM